MRKFKKFVVEMLSSFAALYKPVLMKYEVYIEICTFMEKQLVPFCKNMNVKGFVVKRKNV